MSKSPSVPQQGGTPSSPQPQQQQDQGKPTPQQGQTPVFKDWASI
jgi:hypothetical protein